MIETTHDLRFGTYQNLGNVMVVKYGSKNRNIIFIYFSIVILFAILFNVPPSHVQIKFDQSVTVVSCAVSVTQYLHTTGF